MTPTRIGPISEALSHPQTPRIVCRGLTAGADRGGKGAEIFSSALSASRVTVVPPSLTRKARAVRKPHIDGLRLPLFMMVFVVHHFGWPYLDYSLPGFFTLSGFVVTITLLEDNEPSLWQKVTNFYLRRSIRIYPLYYVVVIILLIFSHLTFPFSYIFHTFNIELFVQSISADEYMRHAWLIARGRLESVQVWSLGVEEQFYLLYPLILYATPPARRIAILLAAIPISITMRTWLSYTYPTAFYGTLLPVQMEYLAWGGVFAILTAQRRLVWLPPAPVVPLAAGGVALLVVIERKLGMHSLLPFRPSLIQTPVAPLLGLLVWGLWNVDPRNIIARILGFRVISYLGSITFGMYLIHLMTWDVYRHIRVALFGTPPQGGTLEFFFGTLMTTIVLSMISWHVLEKPACRLRKYIGRGRKRKSEPPVSGAGELDQPLNLQGLSATERARGDE